MKASIRVGLIKEGKIPSDNRVPLTPAQCKWIQKKYPHVTVIVQSSNNRCFTDKEYVRSGLVVTDDISDCDILMGIKEVPVNMLIENKTYLFFSHTKKLQPANQSLLHAIVKKKITLIDYECLEHEDGTRIIGFGFFAGIVGAHNGMMAFGQRTGLFKLDRVNATKNLQHLIHTYFGLKIPNIKIAITGSGRVAHGLLEIMNLLGIHEVEPEDFKRKEFTYPVYVHLKGADLYVHKSDGNYVRDDFHERPENYVSKFKDFLPHTDILMNGVYWENKIPRLFEMEDMKKKSFKIKTIADVTDDKNGSVPINLGDSTIEEPVYGVDKKDLKKTAPYLQGSVDVMAVGNLPNELPRDASRYFGEQLLKFVLPDLLQDGNKIIDDASITKKGILQPRYDYMRSYADDKMPHVKD